jgi:hypothetical protein
MAENGTTARPEAVIADHDGEEDRATYRWSDGAHGQG